MITATAEHRRTRRLTATAPPYPPPARPRLREALGVLATERALGADYRPDDLPILSAWDETRARCVATPVAAIDHLDAFLAVHLDTLRDLTLRARHGMGPTTFLDEIERTLVAHFGAGRTDAPATRGV